MIRNRNLLKSFAIFFLVEVLTNVIAPTVSLALTSGPTAPEATSFEPVDTTDIVDLKTGDFVYNIPLLEVPGPAGGYPLSLSYHAGILPGQEASWTGLGFTLNPGSISRLVNGYPDDHVSVTNVDRSYWAGGNRETYTVGVSVSIANVASVSAGLTFANDTYKGRGTGGYVGAGIGYSITNNIGIGLNGQVNFDPYGGTSTSAGIGVGISSGAGLSASAGVNWNSKSGYSGGTSINYGFGGNSALGLSMSSDGSTSMTAGGGSKGIHNGKSNHVSYKSDNFQIDIPIYYAVNLRLGRDYQRYWIDESKSAQTYGSLYMDGVTPSDLVAFDTYDLLDKNVNLGEFRDEEKLLGGSYPDVDIYNVTGQGIGGNIKPYHYQQHLYRQDKMNESNTSISRSYPLSSQFNKSTEFRFIGDFSNRLEYTPEDFQFNASAVTFNFDKNKIQTGESGIDGYNKDNNHLAGSKHIEWYTNSEILSLKPYKQGFVNCITEGFTRAGDSQVGGYSITNSSGITYHYALPAYSYDEYMKSVNSSTKQIADGERYNELKKPTKYAYTWFLTAVTGPDYIDKNENGLADHDDWGYWVNFEYKKWLDDYKWRNPGEGTNRDLDGEFENFASGKKEIYYLEKIVTQSHVAVFEKSESGNGREVSDLYEGGFNPKPITADNPAYVQCIEECNLTNNCSGQGCAQLIKTCTTACKQTYDQTIVTGQTTTRSTLKLDNIKLYNYNDYDADHIGDEYVLKRIAFEYDRLLAKNTPNSFDTNNPTAKFGKLTLLQLAFFGKKNSTSLIPPMTFEYKETDLNNVPLDYKKDYVDVWGFYKNDFDATYRDNTNDVMGRLTTDASSMDIDAWSLKKINSSLGSSIEINYESDRYDEVILESNLVLRTKEVTDDSQFSGTGKTKITFWDKVNLLDYFKPAQIIDIDLVGGYDTKGDNNAPTCTCGIISINPDYRYAPITTKGVVQVDYIDPNNNYILVKNASEDDFYKRLWIDNKRYTLVEAASCGLRACTWYWNGPSSKPTYIIAGAVSYKKEENTTPIERLGGGLRVQSIKLNNTTGDSRITKYTYQNGKTSYEPFQILEPKIFPSNISTTPDIKSYVKKLIMSKFYNQILLARQLPGPGVIYKYVTITEENITPDGQIHILPNYVKYEFITYDKDMVKIEQSPAIDGNLSSGYGGLQFVKTLHNKSVIKDYSAWVGNLKSITLFNTMGTVSTSDDMPLSKTINTYLQDDILKYEDDLKSKFRNQGLITQSFTRARLMLFEKGEKRSYLSSGVSAEMPTLTANNIKNYYFSDNDRHLLATICQLKSFPSIPTGQKNINYKTDIESESKNLAFDFYSGEVTQVLTSDSYGNNYLSVIVPAYKNYNGMGLKVYDKVNKNMLSQTAEQYSYIVNEDYSPTGVLSASVQTWSDDVFVLNSTLKATMLQTNIWRPRASYQWNGDQALRNDGSYPYNNGTQPSKDFAVNSFTYWNDNNVTSEFWQKTAEITLYDTYSHVIEVKDINDNYACTRMNIDKDKVIASASNSKYSEMACSSAEYYIGETEEDGGVARGAGDPSPAHTHTGQYSLLVGSDKEGFNYKLKDGRADLTKKYRASVWVYLPGKAETQSDLDKLQLYCIVNGVEKSISPILQKNKSKSWYLLNLDITPNESNDVFIGVRNKTQRGAYFDDFRVHPLNATLTSYVYDPFNGELNYILDVNNFYTRFEYDAIGRLVRTTKELLNFDFGDNKESYRADVILKEVKYNYGKGN